MTRDVAQKLGYNKPASIYSTFFPALQGLDKKMSSSVASSGIFMTDKPNDIKNKVNKYAFSGGGATLDEHKANGANLDIDVPYQWLRFFLESDEELAHIAEEYGSGRMMTGEIKKKLIDVLQAFIKDFQDRRAKVTDEVVQQFLEVRKIDAMPERFKDAAPAQEEKPKE